MSAPAPARRVSESTHAALGAGALRSREAPATGVDEARAVATLSAAAGRQLMSSALADSRGSFGLRPVASLDLLDSSAHWQSRLGEPLTWRLDHGVLQVVPGSGDVVSTAQSESFQLHVEFWLPHMPDRPPEDRANGGIYLGGRFEIQLLDSSDRPPSVDGCGAIYQVAAPERQAALGAEQWQCLEVAFRSSGGAALVTAFLNGQLIHNQRLVAEPTRGAIQGPPYPALMLQDHGAPIKFRNLWLL